MEAYEMSVATAPTMTTPNAVNTRASPRRLSRPDSPVFIPTPYFCAFRAVSPRSRRDPDQSQL